MIHTVKGFGIVNKAEKDDFLELACFFDDPVDVSNLISGSSAFPQISLNIWKFMVHVLLNPGFENFEHYFTSMWDECNCAVVWGFFGIAFLWDSRASLEFKPQRLKRLPAMWETWVQSLGWEDPLEKKMATHCSSLAWRIPWMEEPGRLRSMGLQRVWHDWATSLSPSLGLEWKLTFSSPVATAVFQVCWHIECSIFTASSFRIWNSSMGIPSPPLALFVVVVPKAHLTLHSRMSGSRWVITPSWLSGSRSSFLYSFLCILATFS